MGHLSPDHRDLRSLLSKAAMSHLQLPWPSVEFFSTIAKGTPSTPLSVPWLSDALITS